MKRGEVLKTTIESVAFGGMGIGRIQGMAVFVPYTVTNDEVTVEIKEVRKRYALGNVRDIVAPSAYRTEPPCRYFGQCGGCHLQHIDYQHQLEVKKRQVLDTFERLGKFKTPPVLDVIPSPRRFHYRIKAEYHVRSKDGSGPEIGFMHAFEDRVLDIERCEIVEEDVNRSYGAFRESLLQNGRKLTDKRHTIWASSQSEELQEIGDCTLQKSLITRLVKDRRLILPHGGFFQVNGALVNTLVEQVLYFADLKGGERVIDGYCGVGLFALFLSPRAGSIVGIDINEAAVQCARTNLTLAGMPDVSFFAGNVGDVLWRQFVRKNITADVVILDPPRSGCSRDILDAVEACRAKKVIYISCNPATQARDIRYLVEKGFSLQCLQPLDMFPQTGHIEVIGLLRAD